MNEKLLNYNSQTLNKIINNTKAQFVVQEENVPTELLCSADGLLGLFLLEASSNYEIMFNESLNLSFYEDENAILEYYPVISKSPKNSASIWTYLLLHSVESVIEKNKTLIAKEEPVPLDGLYENWMKTEKKIISNPKLSPSENNSI